MLEGADQVFIDSNGDMMLIMNVGDAFKTNYHVLHFDKKRQLQKEAHINASFIDSIVDNTIHATYHYIEGWAATDARTCKNDTLDQYKTQFNNLNFTGSNQYCKNIVDSVFLDTSYLVHIYYRVRPKGAYYDIEDIKEAESLLTEKRDTILHINHLNFEYGNRFSIRKNNIDALKRALFLKRECFLPKNDSIIPLFYKQLFQRTQK